MNLLNLSSTKHDQIAYQPSSDELTITNHCEPVYCLPLLTTVNHYKPILTIVHQIINPQLTINQLIGPSASNSFTKTLPEVLRRNAHDLRRLMGSARASDGGGQAPW